MCQAELLEGSVQISQEKGVLSVALLLTGWLIFGFLPHENEMKQVNIFHKKYGLCKQPEVCQMNMSG